MMTAATETRKRSREDDSCDSTPLSKRINNLHIDNLDDPNYQHQSSSSSSLSNEAFFASESNADASPPSSYSPELDHLQNPYYYNKNKLLYELHAERMRRCHDQDHEL